MPFRSRRTLLNVAVSLAVVAGSFWITLKFLDNLAAPVDPDADLIVITEATYGMSCQGFVRQGSEPVAVKPGNVTGLVTESCPDARKTCSFLIDTRRFSDPAPGCNKDLSISWRCGSAEAVHQTHVAGEAQSQRASLACPAR